MLDDATKAAMSLGPAGKGGGGSTEKNAGIDGVQAPTLPLGLPP